jgi:O-antigen/teichoic acid export membrane protein
MAAAGVTAAVFIIGIPVWAPRLSWLVTGPLTAAWFVAATMAWTLFVMQDNVLVAVRRAGAVPAENLAFSLVKLGLVVVLAGLLPLQGIFASWTLGMLVAVVGTTMYLFAAAIPAHIAATSELEEPITLRAMARFTAADYIGSLCWIAATALMPVLVLELAGAAATAAFAMAWQITLSLYQIPVAMGQSLVAHAAADQAGLERYHREALRHSLQLLVPAVAVIVVAAPWLLAVFGDVYADRGTPALRLLALSALPQAITALAVSKRRVQRRMRAVVALLSGLGLLVLGLAVLLVPLIGIAGVGLAWLVAQTVLATILIVGPDRPTRTRGNEGGGCGMAN